MRIGPVININYRTMPWLNRRRIQALAGFIIAIVIWEIVINWPMQQTAVQLEPPAGDHMKTVHQRLPGMPIVVSVFYEALCPDSKNFVINQLLPTFYKAPTLLEVQLVPYGKAETTINRDGSLSFTCQHGPNECDANTYHACVIETTDEPKVMLDVIACMIRNNVDPKGAMQKCTREHHMDTEQVQKCFDSPHGAELLNQYGELTHALAPPVSFIPTVTLDGAQRRQATILKDLLGEVCKIAGGKKLHPDECAE